MQSSMIKSVTEDFGNGGTIDGDLTISGDLQVSGGGSLSFDEIVQGTQVIDVTNTEALLVRKNGDGGDVFVVDTTNSRVGIGTASPSELLTVNGGNIKLTSSTSSSPFLTIEDTNADDNMGGLKFIKDSASPNTGDKLMQIWAYGDNNAAEQILYSEIATLPTSVSDGSEEGSMRFRVMNAGSFGETMRIRGGNVGIGTTSPDTNLHIHKASAGSVTTNANAQFTIENSSHASMQFLSPNNANSIIYFGDVDDNDVGYINYAHSSNTMNFQTNAVVRMSIDGSGNMALGADTDVSAELGRAHIGYIGFSDMAGFSHVDLNAPSTFALAQSSAGKTIVQSKSGQIIAFKPSGSDKVAINSTGLGIGTESPASALAINVTDGQNIKGLHITQLDGGEWTSMMEAEAYGLLIRSTANDTTPALKIQGNGTSNEVLTALSNGNVGIGTTSPSGILSIFRNDSSTVGTNDVVIENDGSGDASIKFSLTGATDWYAYVDNSDSDKFKIRRSTTDHLSIDESGNATFGGNATVNGALSKGSGSFKIDHPLQSKKETHHLVHSFVEAPQADNIYRGKVTLSSGSVEINLDTVSGMSEGTFVLLNTDIQCFTSNESDWDAVKGSVNKNILTISCQNTDSTANVSWLVIGERQDDHMKETNWTDENGKVIVEPVKIINE